MLGPVFPEVAHRGPSNWSGGGISPLGELLTFVFVGVCVCVCLCMHTCESGCIKVTSVSMFFCCFFYNDRSPNC